MKIGIGIDTGGTYTDAVIVDLLTKEVLHSSKSLTTKEDLSIGITNAVKALPSELYKDITLVSLSTTLATNACVEDKGGRAKLILMGAYPNVVERSGKNYGLPPLDEIYLYDSHTSFAGDILDEVDWDSFINQGKEILKDADSIGITEIHAMNNGAVLEKQAREQLKKRYNLPIICGHELYSDLNVLQRGASTLLNARLFPIIETFLAAIKLSLGSLGINAPIVIVRSDSTLMSEEFTSTHPVETLLCGPAASVMGGVALTNERDSLIIDMGGTTTDIAMVQDGVAISATNGIKVGSWKTYVKGLLINTFGLGGDTAVRFNKHSQLLLSDQRITPICVLASEYPQVVPFLKKLSVKSKPHTHLLHEFFCLVRDISDSDNYSPGEKALCNALKSGPLSLADAASAICTDVYNLNTARLEREGVVMRSGVTPTDIMHIKGDFSRYDNTASIYAASFVATCIGCTLDELADRVYDMVKRKLYVNIARMLLENSDSYYQSNGIDEGTNHLIEHSYELAKSGEDSFFTPILTTKATFIGIGAPTHIFLPDVAKAFKTRCIIPQHAQVANAVGALCCKLSASSQVLIKQNNLLAMEGDVGYIVYAADKNVHFEDLDDAIVAATECSKTQAIQLARERGAHGELSVSTTVNRNTSTSRDNVTIFLSVSVTSTATQQ